MCICLKEKARNPARVQTEGGMWLGSPPCPQILSGSESFHKVGKCVGFEEEPMKQYLTSSLKVTLGKVSCVCCKDSESGLPSLSPGVGCAQRGKSAMTVLFRQLRALQDHASLRFLSPCWRGQEKCLPSKEW